MSTQKPMLLFVAGYAGSGKSMIGKIIASKLRAPYIDKDTIAGPLVGRAMEIITGDPNDRTSDFYCSNFKRLEYECMLNMAIENAKLSPWVVVSGPFTQSPGSAAFQDPKWVDHVDRLCKKIGANWHVLWVYASDGTIKKMLEARKAPRDQWKLSHWEEYIAQYHKDQNNFTLPIPNYTVMSNDNRNLHDVAKDIDAFLQNLGFDGSN